MAHLETRDLTCATYQSTCRLVTDIGPALEGKLGHKCADFTSSLQHLTTMNELIRYDDLAMIPLLISP